MKQELINVLAYKYFERFIFIHEYVLVCVYVHNVHAGAQKEQRATDALELELQAIVGYLMQVLGNKLGSSTRVVNKLTTQPSLKLALKLDVSELDWCICWLKHLTF